MVFAMKIPFLGMFTIIFAISALKYMSMQSLMEIGIKRFSKIHPFLVRLEYK